MSPQLDAIPYLLAAADFAARRHAQQRRRDAAQTPYINHPLAVANLLVRVGGVQDPVTLQAALLHDTVEDTDTSAQEIEDHFGLEVRRVVEEVTDDKSLPKEVRKRLQIEHAPSRSHRARLIKLADKSCNINDLSPTDPPTWRLERKLQYLDWALAVVNQIRGTNPALEAHFDRTYQAQRQRLAAPPAAP